MLFLVCLAVKIIAAPELLPEKTVTLEPVFNLSNLSPRINPANIVSFPSTIAVDESSNIYICDGDKHRILKFRLQGNLVKQIGRDGQSKQDLHYPQGILIKDGILYVLDDGGKQVKLFNYEGNYIKSFEINEPRPYCSDSILVHGKYIYLDTRYQVKDWNDRNLISVFTVNGKIEGSFGRILPSKRRLVYRVMNRTYLSLYNGTLYGSFITAPVVFRYSLDGKELLFRDLRHMDIDVEVNGMFKKSIDNPDDDPVPGRVRVIAYINGFIIDQNGNYLLTLNDYERHKSLILALSPEGDPF